MASRVSSFDPAGDPLRPDAEGLAVHLVPMRRRHLRSVLRIEAQVYPRPWSLPLFMSELNMRASRVYYVARVQGTVVGYCGLMLVDGDAHITNIAVAGSATGYMSRPTSRSIRPGIASRSPPGCC